MQPSYLFIHGAWHASWCWQHVAPLLRERELDVLTPDLPGHGQNKMHFVDISLNTYVDYITQLIVAQKKPVVLIGHSMAGIILSQVAENISQHIHQLVYISAFIPEHNGSLVQEAEKSASPGISTELAINADRKEIILKKTSKTRNLLFTCWNEADAKLATSLLQNEPLQPFLDTISLSNEYFGKVKKLYIECLKDQVLPAEDQKRMYQKINCEVISIDADHSPFFSQPAALADIIINRCYSQ